ncbi:aldo-keto reductase family 1 member A1-A-like [Apostichopus japonicus]|uniref:aldo-keto reductase family 1 member A1-A-like n=1 Tax=Stichopus japonicus TaxID=307972 RepID=UPI003AB6E686
MPNLLSDDGRNVRLPTGKLMPVLGLGTYTGDHADQVYNACVAALKSGYKLLDCAYAYGNEEEIGRAVKDCIKDGTIKRVDLFITNKLWNTMHRPEDVRPACERSLKTMGLDYFDLYIIHWPFALAKPDDPNQFFKLDDEGKKIMENVPIVDTWKAMETLVDAGLCKAIGLSNFNINQMERIRAIAKHPISNNQVEVQLYLSQVEMLQYCTKNNITMTAYSPLYAPRRIWQKEGDPPPLLDNETIIAIGKKYGKSPAQVMLRFQAQRGIAIVPKSFTPSRIKANIDIFDFKLKDEDMKALHGFNKDHRSIGGFAFEGMDSHPEFPW